ncbi:MAG TPA: quinolinate synthase NadA [Chlamydiales bacterium]|nr:quinolinate synthase NadA [Chlamydiales bacterium]
MKKPSWTLEELYSKLKKVKVDNLLCQYTESRCKQMLPYINDILKLKEEKDATILAHSYVHPDIIYGIADHVGDSYELSKKAKETTKSTIVFPAVRFMAETAKILNPDKTVLDPNPNSRCSLADSIEYATLLKLKDKYPHHTFVCYINTTAAIKALCDVCVTSANAEKIIENIPSDKIYFLPDALMAQNIIAKLKKKNIEKEILYYDGACHVHYDYDQNIIQTVKYTYPNAKVFAHPECRPEVVSRADMTGSTSQMYDAVKKDKSQNPFLLLTECGIASRLQVEYPQAKIVGSCLLCKYMRANNLEDIQKVLKEPKKNQIIELDKATIENAKKAIDKMFYYSQMETATQSQK